MGQGRDPDAEGDRSSSPPTAADWRFCHPRRQLSSEVKQLKIGRDVPTEDSACVVPLVALGHRSIVSIRQPDSGVPGPGKAVLPEVALPFNGLAELLNCDVRHDDVLGPAVLTCAVAGDGVKRETFHPGALQLGSPHPAPGTVGHHIRESPTSLLRKLAVPGLRQHDRQLTCERVDSLARPTTPSSSEAEQGGKDDDRRHGIAGAPVDKGREKPI